MNKDLTAVYFPTEFPRISIINTLLTIESAIEQGKVKKESRTGGLPNLWSVKIDGVKHLFIKHPEKEIPIIYFTLKSIIATDTGKVVRISGIAKHTELIRGELDKYHGYQDLPSRIILDLLVPEFSTVSCGRLQTEDGKRLWDNLVKEMFIERSNYHLYLWDFRDMDKIVLRRLKTYRAFKNLESMIYGNSSEHKNILLVISNKELKQTNVSTTVKAFRVENKG